MNRSVPELVKVLALRQCTGSSNREYILVGVRVGRNKRSAVPASSANLPGPDRLLTEGQTWCCRIGAALDPAYSDPAYSDPAYSDPAYSDPAYSDPAHG